MNDQVLVLAEHSEQGPDAITMELLSQGRKLADQLGAQLGAVVLGSGIQGTARQLAGMADNVYCVDNANLKDYNPEVFAKVLAEVLRDSHPKLFLLGYTYTGMEMGAAVAAMLETPLVSNCLGIELGSGGNVVVERPVPGGTRVKLELGMPLFVSVAPGVLSAQEIRGTCRVIAVPLPGSASIEAARVRVKEVFKANAADGALTKADIIVAVGRGIGSANNLSIFKDMAAKVGGAIACTRPILDMGWLPQEHLVGLSGYTVKPKLYIACGISGASQHAAGMSGSSAIMAINKDPQAPIFGIAHYGIVSDVMAVAPEIMRQLATLS
ncbi:MAG: electron transfer flavoprotein subunit alpha/FixB family protein [Dehalococcoidia bacterium]|nr:electron transfer flavoprotein subunit alpha/FixB family protein [Dehalococcoidia bacterium]